MNHRRAAALLVAAVLAMLATTLTGFSSAAFTSRSTATATVTAAADWTPPTVAVVSPGPSVRGTVTLTATASDAESGIRDVVIQVLAPGASSWTTLCTDTTAPYSCSWTTTTGTPDGTYDVRARATDNAGYSTTSSTVRTVVSNSLTVVLSNPGDVMRGSVSLTATVYGPGSLVYTTSIEYSVAGRNDWKQMCGGVMNILPCTYNTTALASGDYDFRARASNLGTVVTSAVWADVTVDNTAPTAVMVDPGSPLSGTRTLAATVSDAHSGVAQVVVERQLAGTTAWTPACTITMEPWSCRFGTTTIPDGSYSFRAVVTDVAGNVTTSAAVTNRVVNNTVSSVSIEPPAAYLSGTVQLAASASSTAGVTWVQLQYAPAGTTTWTEACTVAAAPYTCAWNSTTVADGLYDLRAVMLDGSKTVTTSTVESGRRVDNTPLRGLDVQTYNNGAIVGRPEPGDSLTFTWTDQIAPASVLTGWSGGATPVSVRLRDGNAPALGTGNKGDTLDVLVGSQAVNLGSVNLREDYVKPNKTVTFAATMTASTVTVDGLPRTMVTIVLGAPSGQTSALRSVSTPSTMVWSPSGNVTDLRGVRSSTVPTSELGPLDREF